MVGADELREAVSAALERRMREAPSSKRFRFELAEAVGRDDRTIERWIYGEGQIQADALLNLMACLGPGFANEVLALVGYVAAPEADADAVRTALARRNLIRRIGKFRRQLDEVADALGETA